MEKLVNKLEFHSKNDLKHSPHCSREERIDSPINGVRSVGYLCGSPHFTLHKNPFQMDYRSKCENKEAFRRKHRSLSLRS